MLNGALLGAGGSPIKSIQRGTITIATSGTTNTAAITSVDITNSRLRFLGMRGGDGNYYNKSAVRLTFTNGTTITATRDTADASNTVTVSFEVEEYQPGVIKSVQRGTATATGATTGTAAITAVTDLTKTALDYLGETGTDNTVQSDVRALGAITLTNTTTVTVTRDGSVGNVTAGFQVTEFN